ncbi:hypothetical protein LguiA_016251 [Lonicera macranthoides]
MPNEKATKTNNVVAAIATPIAQFGDEDGGCSVHHVASLSRPKKLEPGNHSLENTNRSEEEVQNIMLGYPPNTLFLGEKPSPVKQISQQSSSQIVSHGIDPSITSGQSSFPTIDSKDGFGSE